MFVLGGAGPIAAPQLPATGGLPSFDAASVRVNTSGNPGSRLNTPAGRLMATNVLLRDLIQHAYRVQSFQIVGIPESFANARFDVAATASPEAPPELVARMLQQLLADRFGLAVRRDSRPMPVFALVVARGDGRLGPDLNPSPQECTRVSAAGPLRAPDLEPRADGRPSCGMQMSPARIRAGGVTMSQLANALSGYVHRAVVDDTHLTGFFDFDLRYAPEGRGGGPAVSSDSPAIVTAVQEQLGLRLAPRQAPLDVLVVERVQQPREN